MRFKDLTRIEKAKDRMRMIVPHAIIFAFLMSGFPASLVADIRLTQLANEGGRALFRLRRAPA